ncbi:MAG: phosphonate ABC transporter, permease protein PhnE [SAR324 cluster bacterium]|nr:phosphonate ABC transporter, permease protein PhnE [SAR324 cluster bacterium]
MNELPSRTGFLGSKDVLYGLIAILVIAWGTTGSGLSWEEAREGIPYMGSLVMEMIPPSFERIEPVSKAILETFQIALTGAGLGIFLSIFLAVLSAKNMTKYKSIRFFARGIVSFFRTIPDLVWAIFFVSTVGLGPFAGTLTIMIDTLGFCGRFFAEAFEEVEQEPINALEAMGANPLSIFFANVFPASFPSLINTSLFSVEKAVRSSVVLGLVGAGGIGIELKVAMDMFQYSEASTIILLIFVMVLAVEQLNMRLRRKVMSI